jgi:hypothetical protein
VAEDPEQVLPKNWLATSSNHKKVSAKAAVEHQLTKRNGDSWKSEYDQKGYD